MTKTFQEKIFRKLCFYFEYYFICRTNKVKYLRKQGVKIGDYCDILTTVGNFGSEPYLIRMGNNVTIAGGVLFITHDGATRIFRDLDDRWKKETGLYGCIDIGDHVFIGVNSIILPGVHLGSNCVVGAGAVVTRDVPDGMVVAGNPATIICSIKEYQEKAIKKTVVIDPKGKKRHSLEKIFWN